LSDVSRRRNHSAEKILIGYGANCNSHKEKTCSTGCKKQLTMGRYFTPDEVKAKLKLWLVKGLDEPPLAYKDFPRTWHVHLVEAKDLPVHSEAELDRMLTDRGIVP
jgi:hypothetical protein